jgi:hypothetical protein
MAFKGPSKSPYLISIFRSKAEVYSEKERLKPLPSLSGTEPPTPENREEEGYNFFECKFIRFGLLSQYYFPR